jgi:hypothetical protein
MPIDTFRMIERADGSGYRHGSTSEVRRLIAVGTIELEGVDGDEYANTVTYWYRRAEEV